MVRHFERDHGPVYGPARQLARDEQASTLLVEQHGRRCVRHHFVNITKQRVENFIHALILREHHYCFPENLHFRPGHLDLLPCLFQFAQLLSILPIVRFWKFFPRHWFVHISLRNRSLVFLAITRKHTVQSTPRLTDSVSLGSHTSRIELRHHNSKMLTETFERSPCSCEFPPELSVLLPALPA